MKNTTVIAKDRSIAQDTVTTELNKVGIGAISIASALIGCWAVACFVSGMVASGGAVNFVSNYIVSLVG